jgi:hypothetical protein
VWKTSRRDRRKKVSLVLPWNGRDAEPLADAEKCYPLSHRMGEGRGEGRNAEQPRRAVEFTHCALTLNPSPVRREREMRHPPKCLFSSLAAV